jgi:hypothetical protein
VNVTVSGNVASGTDVAGAGINTAGPGRMTLVNVTVSGNAAIGTNSAIGGGIVNFGTMTLTNVTVTGNTASGGNIVGAGGIHGARGFLNTTLLNTLVVLNVPTDCGVTGEVR